MTLCRLSALLILLTSTAAAEEWSYWIEPCTPEAAKSAACKPDDPELGKWALEAWARESGGALTFRLSPTEQQARLRIHWANGQGSLYGEAVSVKVRGKKGGRNYFFSQTQGRGRGTPPVPHARPPPAGANRF